MAAIALTLFAAIHLKKTPETACKMTKRPVVELFAPAGINPNRSYSGFVTEISTVYS
jgi:hypothetical protein